MHGTLRPNLVNALGTKCRYCREIMTLERPPSRDHVLPRSKGGTLAGKGGRIICQPCNVDKDNMTLTEFLAHLIRNRDPRAATVLSHLQGLIARGLYHLCDVAPPE